MCASARLMATSSLTLPTVGELRLPDKLERTTKRTDDRKSWSTNNFWFRGESFLFAPGGGSSANKNSPPAGNPFILNHVRSANVEFSEIIYRERRSFDFPKLKYFISSAATTNGNRKSHVSYLSPSKHPPDHA